MREFRRSEHITWYAKFLTQKSSHFTSEQNIRMNVSEECLLLFRRNSNKFLPVANTNAYFKELDESTYRRGIEGLEFCSAKCTERQIKVFFTPKLNIFHPILVCLHRVSVKNIILKSVWKKLFSKRNIMDLQEIMWLKIHHAYIFIFCKKKSVYLGSGSLLVRHNICFNKYYDTYTHIFGVSLVTINCKIDTSCL